MLDTLFRMFTAAITAFNRTDANGVVQLQVKDRVAEGEDGDEGAYDSAYCDDFSSWCLIAPPAPPDTDDDGNIDGAAEACAWQDGDESTIVGTRDVRVQKYGADLKGGEVAFVNYWGTRLALKRYEATLSHAGGFLSFNAPEGGGTKTVTLAGIPDAPGGRAAYITIASGGVGVVSATGAASINVVDDQITASGAAASLDVGSISLVKGAADPVVTVSTLQPILTALFVHLTAAAGMIGAPPPVIATAVGSTRVKGAP